MSDYDLLSLDAVSGKMQVSMRAMLVTALTSVSTCLLEGLLALLQAELVKPFTGDWVLSKAGDELGCLPSDTEAGPQECWQIVSNLACLHVLHNENRCCQYQELQAYLL